MTAHHAAMQVFRHCSDTAEWEMVRRRPHPRLRDYVQEYVGYDERSPAPLQRLEVAKSSVILIVNLGPPLRLIGPGKQPVVEDHGSFLAGMYDGPVITETPGAQRGVEVKLTPIGAHLLLGRPMSALTNRAVDLADLLGSDAAELAARMREAPGWADRFAVLEAFLGRRIEAAGAAPPEVELAWRRLRSSRGNAPIGALAAELGWSRKRLIERFRTAIGLTPKTAARLLRFCHAVELVDRDGDPDWADVAIGSGYYDQAHFIRDFRQFAGRTPGDYRRGLLPDSGGVAAS